MNETWYRRILTDDSLLDRLQQPPLHSWGQLFYKIKLSWAVLVASWVQESPLSPIQQSVVSQYPSIDNMFAGIQPPPTTAPPTHWSCWSLTSGSCRTTGDCPRCQQTTWGQELCLEVIRWWVSVPWRGQDGGLHTWGRPPRSWTQSWPCHRWRIGRWLESPDPR